MKKWIRSQYDTYVEVMQLQWRGRESRCGTVGDGRIDRIRRREGADEVIGGRTRTRRIDNDNDNDK